MKYVTVVLASCLAGCGSSSTKGHPDAPPSDGDHSDGAQLFDGDHTGDGELLPDAANGIKRVFITHDGYPGDLKTAGGGANGHAGADNLCMTAASALGGTWVAWVSTSEISAIDRVSDVPYYLVDGTTLVASGKVQLSSGTLAHAISKDQTGADTLASPWTGTVSDGTVDGSFHCLDWTSSDANSHFGETGNSTATDTRWTELNTVGCSDLNNLYCFEK